MAIVAHWVKHHNKKKLENDVEKTNIFFFFDKI